MSKICRAVPWHAASRPTERRPRDAMHVRMSEPRKSNYLIKIRAGDKSGPGLDRNGAGSTIISPGWLTAVRRNWGGGGDTPVANARPEQVADLLGGALFQALYTWFEESGPVYLLPTGPFSSFLVISDPNAARHVLQKYGSVYSKGLVREVSEFLFGDGFAVAEGELWRVRRRAVGPGFHKFYLDAMVRLVFAPSAERMLNKFGGSIASNTPVNIEAYFSQVTLDIVGKAVFNYDFDALNADTPVIQAVYDALKETEQRATDLLPIWKVPELARIVSPRQRRAQNAVRIIRTTTQELIDLCKAKVNAEQAGRSEKSEIDLEFHVDESDPSILRFLLAARDETTEIQLRDDLLSLLVAGHETTGSVLTWTTYLLAENVDALKRAQHEVDCLLIAPDGTKRNPTYDDLRNRLPFLTRCINESMRLYPHPPVLLRRADKSDTLPGGEYVPEGQDVMISVYNIHRSKEVWGPTAHAFDPMRFGPLDGPIPNEQNTEFRYIPFSGGPRKCVGDQFALLEATTVLSMLIRDYNFYLLPNQEIGLTTGATIHTTNGLFMILSKR